MTLRNLAAIPGVPGEAVLPYDPGTREFPSLEQVCRPAVTDTASSSEAEEENEEEEEEEGQREEDEELEEVEEEELVVEDESEHQRNCEPKRRKHG